LAVETAEQPAGPAAAPVPLAVDTAEQPAGPAAEPVSLAVETAEQPAEPAPGSVPLAVEAAEQRAAKLAEEAEARLAEAARLAKAARALEKPLVKTAEELTADAKLAELRRLPPEQEAAAAKAAQRIGEVAAAAEAAPEEDRAAAAYGDGEEYWVRFGGGSVEPLLEHTPLIDLEYLVALADGGGVMPCGRQNVPPAAFITKRNLWRLKLWGKATDKASLGVLVLSYPWLDWFHPDRLGAQLRRLLSFLKAMLAEAKRDSPHCTVGVMVDFLCLPQKPFATEEDGARFGVSLKAINAWYFHKKTYTLLVTNPPPEGADYSNTRLHRDRGWCFFEQAASTVVKHASCLLDFGAYKGAIEFGDLLAKPDTCLGQMKAGRTPPIAPDALGERMRARVASRALTFTANADMEFVIGQYEAGFVAAINRVAAEPDWSTRRLYFRDLGWADAEAAELRLALRYAAAKCAFPEGAVQVYVTFGNRISEAAMATLPPHHESNVTSEHAVWEGKFCGDRRLERDERRVARR
jgi:hypothetical protein